MAYRISLYFQNNALLEFIAELFLSILDKDKIKSHSLYNTETTYL
jgi:hypothetical protein